MRSVSDDVGSVLTAGSGSYEMQQNTWLGSMCDEVRKVTLLQGDTM